MKRLPAILFVSLCLAIWAGCKSVPPAKSKAVMSLAIRTMVWDWEPTSDNPRSNVVFNVHFSKDLTLPRCDWAIVATVTGQNYGVTIDKRATGLTLFSVTASNVVTCEQTY